MPRTRKPGGRKRAPKIKHEDCIASLKLLPGVESLPLDFIDEHKVYWNQFVGKPFKNRIGSRGQKEDNATTWTTKKFIKNFCDKFYPHLTIAERKQYEFIIGPKVYSYLTNHSTRGTTGVTVKYKPTKQRVYAHDIWKRENPEAFDAAMEAHMAEHADVELNVGTRRSLTIAFFQKLPATEQASYQIKANEALKTIQALERLGGFERERYITEFPRVLKALLKEAERCTGIRVNAQILSDDTDGNFKITLVMSDGLKGLRNSAAVAQSVHALKQWVEDTAGKQVNGGPPPIAVYPDPDPNMDMYPRLPDYTGLKAHDLQKLLRSMVSLVWTWLGGTGKVPWELISGAVDDWIDPERRPSGAVFKDPSGLPLDGVLVWLDFFGLCQDGTIPAEKRFQFIRVIAGSSPLDPSCSQESSRRLEYFPSYGKDVWVLEFTGTVTKCHAAGGMQFPEPSMQFARYLATGDPLSSAVERLPEWQDLPAGDQRHLATVIDGDEKALILESASALPATQGELIANLVDAVNEHQAHLPGSTTAGVWLDDQPAPQLLPSYPPPPDVGVSLFRRFWLPVGYYQAPKRDAYETSFAHLEEWQGTLLTSLRHSPSATLLGGPTGCVWVVRILILLLLNLAAIQDELAPPVPPPSGYDLARHPHASLLMSWCGAWLDELRKSMGVLKETSAARRAANILCDTSSQPTESATDGTPAPPSPTPKKRAKRPKPVKKSTKQPVRKGAATSDESEEDLEGEAESEPDEDDEEQDYDKLDQPSGSELDEDDEQSNFQDSGADETVTSKGVRSNKRTDRVPGNEPSTTAADTASTPKHVFGPFHRLPPAPKPIPPPSYDAIHTSLTAGQAMVTQILEEWRALANANPILRSGDVDVAAKAATTCPLVTRWRPLVEFIAIRRIAWANAKTVAPLVLDLDLRMFAVYRSAVQAVTVSDRYRASTEEKGNPLGEDLDALDKLELELEQGIAELRWCRDELRAFDRLAATRRAEFEDLLDGTDFPSDFRALRKTVRALGHWYNDTKDLNRELQKRRQKLWEVTEQPFGETQRTRLWYVFGNPSRPEVPEGFRDSLDEALALGDSVPEPESTPDAPEGELERRVSEQLSVGMVTDVCLTSVEEATQVQNDAELERIAQQFIQSVTTFGHPIASVDPGPPLQMSHPAAEAPSAPPDESAPVTSDDAVAPPSVVASPPAVVQPLSGQSTNPPSPLNSAVAPSSSGRRGKPTPPPDTHLAAAPSTLLPTYSRPAAVSGKESATPAAAPDKATASTKVKATNHAPRDSIGTRSTSKKAVNNSGETGKAGPSKTRSARKREAETAEENVTKTRSKRGKGAKK